MSGILGQDQLGDFLLGDGSDRFTGAFGQAQALISTRRTFGQAQAFIVPTRKFGQAQAYIFPKIGFLVTVNNNVSGFNFDTGTFYGRYWEHDPNMPDYHLNSTHPPVYPGSDNWGMWWDTLYWTADVSGLWTFATSSDDGSYLYVYDESNNFIGGINNNYTGGQPNTYHSTTVSLTAGTKYRLEMKWAQ